MIFVWKNLLNFDLVMATRRYSYLVPDNSSELMRDLTRQLMLLFDQKTLLDKNVENSGENSEEFEDYFYYDFDYNSSTAGDASLYFYDLVNKKSNFQGESRGFPLYDVEGDLMENPTMEHEDIDWLSNTSSPQLLFDPTNPRGSPVNPNYSHSNSTLFNDNLQDYESLSESGYNIPKTPKPRSCFSWLLD